MLKTRLALAALLAAAAALVVLLAASIASAENLESKLDAKEAKLSEVRERSGVLTTTISRYGDRIDRLTGEVASLRNQEAAVEVRLDAKQAELDQAVAQLDVAKKRLVEMRAHLKRALVALRERLVAIYETGTPDVLSVIVGADGYDDLIDRTEYLNRIRGNDEAIVGRVRDLRDQVKRTVARLRTVKNQIEAARDAIAAEEQALASARAAVQERQSSLVAVRASRVAALKKIEATEEHLHGEVADIQAELAVRLGAMASSPLPAGPIRYGSGQLIWPVDGAVVSGFGMRWGRMHEGIDIAAPAGTPIRAADSGTVVLLQSEAESGGYGNFTCLDHGGGLQTCYAHLSSFAVGAGQSVSQGDIIGYVGCTGHCYGDHLHFEVRIGGSPTDPLGYL
ncbi:MAG TPA: peptidoglycan DD-metalloendopeptidase family protein [Solirubrobacterales bacterium]|nr:peptidoglycan DD-metalloendopeptidase family protein [Solirubrobacterales bacterium]